MLSCPVRYLAYRSCTYMYRYLLLSRPLSARPSSSTAYLPTWLLLWHCRPWPRDLRQDLSRHGRPPNNNSSNNSSNHNKNKNKNTNHNNTNHNSNSHSHSHNNNHPSSHCPPSPRENGPVTAVGAANPSASSRTAGNACYASSTNKNARLWRMHSPGSAKHQTMHPRMDPRRRRRVPSPNEDPPSL